MSGPKVYKMARKLVYKMINESLLKNSLKVSDINLLVPHQASGTAIKAYSKFGGFAEEKVLISFINTEIVFQHLYHWDSVLESKII